jgi:hypothetical protein
VSKRTSERRSEASFRYEIDLLSSPPILFPSQSSCGCDWICTLLLLEIENSDDQYTRRCNSGLCNNSFIMKCRGPCLLCVSDSWTFIGRYRNSKNVLFYGLRSATGKCQIYSLFVKQRKYLRSVINFYYVFAAKYVPRTFKIMIYFLYESSIFFRSIFPPSLSLPLSVYAQLLLLPFVYMIINN